MTARLRKMKRIAAAALMAVLLVAMSFPAFAFPKPDQTIDATLRVEFIAEVEYETDGGIEYRDVAVSGMTFRAYRVADMNEIGSLFVRAPFDEYGFEPQEDHMSYRRMAETLSYYVRRDRRTVKADYVAKTNANGIAVFGDGGKVERGMYLITGDSFIDKNGITWFAEPGLITVPDMGPDGNWVYDVTIRPKYDYIPGEVPPPDITEVSVQKVWSGDSANTATTEEKVEGRPEYIEVQLLCDGDVIDTVRLSKNGYEVPADSFSVKGKDGKLTEQPADAQSGNAADNQNTDAQSGDAAGGQSDDAQNSDAADGQNADSATGEKVTIGSSWRHTWKNLAPGHTYTVVEKTVPEGYSVAIEFADGVWVITNKKTTPPPGTPPGKLPQTGQLWWPVPILAGIGFLFLMIAFVRRDHGVPETVRVSDALDSIRH